jgi:NADH:ubiquinone oxidoreductase subunit
MIKNFFLKVFTWWHGQTLGTQWFTWRKGTRVGQDEWGNVYYRAENIAPFGERRWVIYNGLVEATKIPARWHAWMHHRTDQVPGEDLSDFRNWQKGHKPNMTGTSLAYHPPGSLLTPSKRDSAIGDYEAWSPSD